MANYLKMDKKQTVLALLKLNWSYRRIERETGVRRETIARYDPERKSKAAKVPPGSPTQKRPTRPPGPQSLCERFRGTIEQKLEQRLDARRIHQDLVFEHGFRGSYDSVKRFCRQLKQWQPEVFARIEVAPAQEMQVDFAKAALTRTEGGRYRRPHLFQAVLCHSRHSYEEVVWRQDLPSFIGCVENSLHFFGGVVQTVRIDNLKAGVRKACFFDPDVNAVFAALARHYGFAVVPIRPRRPTENGKVERAIAYTKSSALRGRRFESLEEQNEHLKWWNRQVARQRVHGTTRQQVYKRFLQQEQPALRPLPEERFRFFRSGTRTVSADGHVEVERAFYSVPARLLGAELRVEWDERMVRIYHGPDQVALHARQRAGRFQTRDEHLPEKKRWLQQRMENRLLSQASAIGRQARLWAEQALEVRGVLAYRLLQGMISLTRKHSAQVVNQACEVALEHHVFRYRTLLNLCKRQRPKQRTLFSTEHELIRPLSEYQDLLEKGKTE
jgi:transposase